MSFEFSDLYPTVRPASFANGAVNVGYAATAAAFAAHSLGFSVLDGVRVGVLGYGGIVAGTFAYDAVNYVTGDDQGSYATPAITLKPRTLEKDWITKLLEQETVDAANQRKLGDPPTKQQEKRYLV